MTVGNFLLAKGIHILSELFTSGFIMSEGYFIRSQVFINKIKQIYFEIKFQHKKNKIKDTKKEGLLVLQHTLNYNKNSKFKENHETSHVSSLSYNVMQRLHSQRKTDRKTYKKWRKRLSIDVGIRFVIAVNSSHCLSFFSFFFY